MILFWGLDRKSEVIMPNKVFVVTGATSGVGKALALDLAGTGETVVMVARDADRGQAVLKEIAATMEGPNLDLQLCDLSILSSVRNLAEILKSRYDKINVLVNNASTYTRKRVVTVDGFEEMFAANYLGPFLLTNLVLERLQAAVQADGSARIINVTVPSNVPLNLDDMQAERDFKPLDAFGASKTANLLFTLELARRLENSGITVHAVHPGVARSGLNEEETSGLARLFSRLGSNSLEKAGSTILQIATAPDYEKNTGKFFHRGDEIDVPEYARDRVAQQRLWELSEQLTGLTATKGELPINDPHLEQ
jgi:NAD(P)-dependent dehydrogenase (short-subunit alcohol dehydrogenase family)